MITAGFGPFFEAFDQSNIVYVLPALLVPFSLSTAQAGLIAGATPYGMALGCLLAGPLADRYGRKRMFQFFLVWFTIWSGACALAWGFASMVVLRFVLGIGLGGELPVGVTLISELLPRSGRRLLPVYQSFFGFGTIAAAAVSLLLVPAFPGGWRLVFVVGLVPVMYAVLLRRKLPESARWLAQRGRIEEALQAVASLRDRPASIDDQPRPGHVGSGLPVLRVTHHTYKWLDLIRGKYARRTLINTSFWLVASVAAGGNALLYVFLSREGFSLQTTLTFAVIATLASVPGYWTSAYLLERIGRKGTLFSYALVSVIPNSE